MIETIRHWVAELTVMALVLGFAEMILPRNDLRRFVRVVIGLMVVAVILSSLVSISRLQDALAMPSLTGTAETEDRDPASYIARGREIAEAGMEIAGVGLRERISRQIESLARLSSGTDRVSADVLLGPSGGVEKVIVVLKGLGAAGPKPDSRGEGNLQDAAEATELVGKRVERAIRDFYGLCDDTHVIVEAHL